MICAKHNKIWCFNVCNGYFCNSTLKRITETSGQLINLTEFTFKKPVIETNLHGILFIFISLYNIMIQRKWSKLTVALKIFKQTVLYYYNKYFNICRNFVLGSKFIFHVTKPCKSNLPYRNSKKNEIILFA